jgi:hypothetical protein
MIYLFIAATYTPFIAQAEPSTFTKTMLAAVWVVAGAGVILKLVFPGRLERLGLLLCVALGWSGLLAYDAVFSPLPATTVGLIVGGGMLYSGGINVSSLGQVEISKRRQACLRYQRCCFPIYCGLQFGECSGDWVRPWATYAAHFATVPANRDN